MTVLRKRLLGALCAGIAVLAVPALAAAQDGDPPSPPAGVIFGEAAGASLGQTVIAFVHEGGVSTNCGVGQVTTDDEGDVAYVVDVESSGSVDGCAEAGSTVGLWFAPERGGYGATADTTVVIDDDAGGIEANVTLEERPSRLFAPQIARNVSN